MVLPTLVFYYASEQARAILVACGTESLDEHHTIHNNVDEWSNESDGATIPSLKKLT